MTQTAKTVKVLGRIEYVKLNSIVAYKVQASESEAIYTTTLVDGHTSSCTCKGWQYNHKCYHATQCEAKEQARRYDVVAAAVAVYDRAVSDAKVGSFYEDRAEQLRRDAERTALLNYEIGLGI